MEAAQRAEKFRLGGKSRFSDDGLNFEGTHPNNGFQLVIQLMLSYWGVKSAGLLGTVALATLSNNPADLNNGFQLVIHLMLPYGV